MIKKFLLVLSIFSFFSCGFASTYTTWTIVDIKPWRNTFIITMHNRTVWKFKEDPGKTVYDTKYYPNVNGGFSRSYEPRYVPGRSSNNIKYFQQGDQVVVQSLEGRTIVLSDVNGENKIGCVLEDYTPNFLLPTIYEMDSNGYSIIMSDGHEWTFSWWQSFSSYLWDIGDTLVPMYIFPYERVFNLDRMLKGVGYFYAEPY